MVNKAIIVGHLGRDPEIRTIASGQTLAKFSVATNRKWRDRDGNRQEATDWHNVVCWGKQADIAGQYLTKGKLVYVEGRLQTDSWEDRETGKKMFRTEIVCDNFQMLGGRGDEYGSGPPQQSAGSGDFDAAAEDDDIPF